MKIIHEPLRYAHEEGHTDVCYSADGEHFITCGADGDVRIWSVDEMDDPNHTCVGELALSVCQKDDKIYTSTGNNEIQILTHPAGERDGVFTRATDPFNQIVICRNKNFAAVAGEGMSVTLMDLDTSVAKISLSDLGAPCLSVAICPNAAKLAASTGDGKLRIWDVESYSLLKEISCFPKVNSFANAKNLCRLDFEPKHGELLAYPLKNVVKLLNTTTWAEEELKCPEVDADFSVLQYSSCGKYLAAASLKGDFVIWETLKKTVFQTSKHDASNAICGLMWNPKGNGEIVYTDVEGQVSIMSNCSRLQPVDNEEISTEVEKVDENGFTENDVDFGDFLEEEKNEDTDRASPEVLDFGTLDSPDPDARSVDEIASSPGSTRRPRTPDVPMQSPFMPTSTPEHLDPRYLCWNDVGVVKGYGLNSGDEANQKTIEVEFHDSTFHNSMMLQNFQDYTMGSIGKGALAVANSSQIMVIPLAVSNKEWYLKVEEYEEIVLVAASESMVCFAMSNYLVRVATIFGTQRGIVSVPGPPVCMAAFKNALLVAYHAGPVRNSDQNIIIKLFKFEGLNVDCFELGSALGPESTLYWLGFSDIGTPGMMDSLGMLSLFPPKCNTWIPFCDTTKHRRSPGDGFFVTTIFESNQTIGAIRCKGTVYPGFVPRPTVCELAIEPPFAETATDKTQMEMNMFTWSNLNIQDTERKYKETALKIFALACKNDLDQRAFEFMQLVGNQQILNLGLKYTTKLNKRRLSEKLMDLAAVLQEENGDADDTPKSFHSVVSTTEMQMPAQAVIKPRVGKLSISKLTPKTKKTKQEGSQQDFETNAPISNENNLSAVNSQDSLFSEDQSVSDETLKAYEVVEVPRNPFLKKQPTEKARDDLNETKSLTPIFNPFLKKAKKTGSASPLSLTDKNAGISYETPDAKQKSTEVGEKRRLADAESEKPVGKQRKLNQFMFSKRQ
ncbi:WD repeat and HMG-box DNA-binding protein 1 [Dendroctonus ponderosae]|uniref:WD repeat and HMG-box DNA-binding protein 1 n=1 Tax=Dendroctonus ponderosae TaxID=77166 RepID=UPI002035277C|nr:WD repeat and HMG-box DNA-binding protein 1 [Dendroctonus ponderosae]KAH1012098.1 hypothetical protein HUJ05_011315 [Dendroctonus ponderosae]